MATIYGPSTLGEVDNQITFNDFTTYPIYRLKQRAPQRRELREFDLDIPESLGIADWESFIGKEYYILQGTMYPIDETTWRQGREALQKLSSLTVEQADASSDFGYVPYSWDTENGDTRTINMKILYVDLPESTATGLKQPYRLFCKIKYPVMFGAAVSAQIGGAGSITSGSSALSFTLPHALGLTTYSSNGSVTNLGPLAAWPTFEVIGPVSNPVITNSTTGQHIKLNVNLSSSSDTLIITYSQDQLNITLDGNSVLNNLTSDSTLFTIVPGINNLTFTGDTVGAGAFATVAFNSPYPLS